MNFNSLYNKLELIEEAKAGRFESLFQTGYLKKAMIDKGVGVPRPLVFQFIMDFLESKGLVPEGTAFKGSRYAAEAGDFIKKLVDEGMIKDEIADEFKEYTKANLGDFIGRKFQSTKHRTGEFAKKQQMEGGEERGKVAGELRQVKTAEELAAERQAKKDAERDAAKAREGDISPLSTIEAATTLIEIIGDQEIELDSDKVKKFFTAANKGGEFSMDQETPNMIDIEFTENDPIAKVVKKIGSDKVELSIKASLAKMLGLSADEFSVVVHEPTTIEFPQDEPKRRSLSQRFGVDTEGYGMGSIDSSSAHALDEGEEETVTENAKPKIEFISNKDRFKPKTFWQKVAQQELYYR